MLFRSILPELSGPFFSELLAGVEEAARSAGYHLLVAATEPDDTVAPAIKGLAKPSRKRAASGARPSGKKSGSKRKKKR